ncbi:mitochondrial ribosomal small subunit component [Marasmius crinis-equi]|uniref:Small ribosomal subunit protein mS23 n=1 Tax=Marasmius crinis-equi TaxID=585013 RepID=A0ABR3FT58_9AGAR
MARRVASQVHQQVSRLMRGGFITEEPVWFRAVLEHPPLPLPAKAPPSRTAYDTKPSKDDPSLPVSRKKMLPYHPRPLPIYYLEDDIRRQFFRDHPFEAFRPITLHEKAGIQEEHSIKGEAWTRLRQRGRNPSPEDAIQFALNLHLHHEVPLSYAYSRAVAQFRALRSERHISSTMALLEADTLGALFQPSETALGFEKELRSLATWERQAELDEGAMAARKRWRAIAQPHSEARQWSVGQQYVRLWKEGNTPKYAPALTEPEAPKPVPIQEPAQQQSQRRARVRVRQ